MDPFDAGAGGLLRQPRAVWATAGASVVAFMGIGLVDPILPSIAGGLNATPGQVSLLFTSYFLITAVAMLLTGFVSSRIGGRRTLLLGLAFVVVFAGLAGTSGSVGELVGFRAGWGLGNALFVSTALAVIVGAAAGGSAAAILLYESALGLGMACGPLLGALLGDASWRYPFFGTAGGSVRRRCSAGRWCCSRWTYWSSATATTPPPSSARSCPARSSA